MKRVLAASTALGICLSTAHAGGLDRTNLPVDIIFQDGNYLELSFSSTTPKISGTGNGNVVLTGTGYDFLNPVSAGSDYDDVGNGFTNLGLGVKYDINEKLSVSVIFEQPFGADVSYSGDANTTELGGTFADAESEMISGIVRYKFTDRFSAHAGLRYVQARGDIGLSGRAYGPEPVALAGALSLASGSTVPPAAIPFGASANGGSGANSYSVELSNGSGVGFVVGAAYEIPDIALRVALTYNSSIQLDFDTTEFYNGIQIGTSSTEVDLPQSVALDFQTGVAPGTLVFGQIRWAEWSEFKIDPEVFSAQFPGGLVDLDDVVTYTLGVGRQFTDTFSGSFSVTYEDGGDDDLVSPLAPTNGSIAYSLGGRLKLSEAATLSAGIRYTDLGDARPETGTPDVARANFSGNDALTVGFRLGFSF